MTRQRGLRSILGRREWHGKRQNLTRFSIARLIGIVRGGNPRTNLKGRLTLLLLCGLVMAAPSGQAFEDGHNLIQQPYQQPHGSTNRIDDVNEVPRLEPGKPIKRELSAGQQHSYLVNLGSGQFLTVVVEQQGIDVVAQLSGPGGDQIAEFDIEGRSQGQELVLPHAEREG